MESVLGRYRNLVILVGVLFLQILGLAVQVKRSSDTEKTRLIRVWAVDMVTPFERVLIWAQDSADNLWHNYVYLRGVRAENRQLKDQIEQLRLEQVRLNEDAVQAHRLQALLAFKEQYISKTVAAQVIGSSGSDSSRMLYIDKGENQGLKRDMAVITADGIVGKVLQVFPSVSQVLLINDQTSGVGAILEKSRLQGFLKGMATGEVGLEGVMSDEQVVPGERVLTSGGDQIFPKGLPVGTVTKVGTGKDLFLNIQVKPAVNLGKLEEVLVVVERQERQAQTADVGRVRAADILAQRLPSVPDKPAIVPNSAGTVPAGGVAAPKPVAPKSAPTGAEAVAKPPVKSLSGSVVAGSKPASAAATQPKPSIAPAVPDPAKVDLSKVDPAKVDPAKVDPNHVDPNHTVPAPANSQDSPH
ncbi:MAG: rod shape-determining protein MreC [Candidatus Sulfotelmatobacter sp.]